MGLRASVLKLDWRVKKEMRDGVEGLGRVTTEEESTLGLPWPGGPDEVRISEGHLHRDPSTKQLGTVPVPQQERAVPAPGSPDGERPPPSPAPGHNPGRPLTLGPGGTFLLPLRRGQALRAAAAGDQREELGSGLAVQVQLLDCPLLAQHDVAAGDQVPGGEDSSPWADS